jgi:hypothetical protein
MQAAGAHAGPACVAPGEPIQWIADYCMMKMQTDDEIAVSGCIEQEGKAKFPSACASNTHFKTRLCEAWIRHGTRAGTVRACVADPAVMGRTVKNGGVGGAPAEQSVERKVLGLVEVPSLFGTRDPNGPPGQIRPARVEAIALHALPSSSSPVVARLSDPQSIDSAEFAYEALAAVVYGIADGWVLVRGAHSTERRIGWLPPERRGTFHALEDLLASGPSYLDDWNGRLHARAGYSGARKRVSERRKRQDVNILRSATHEGVLWLEVEVLAPGRCEGAQPKALATGWVPAHKGDGTPRAWFHPRGC